MPLNILNLSRLGGVRCSFFESGKMGKSNSVKSLMAGLNAAD